MTGFGRGEAKGAGKRVTVEIRALNHRYLEIVIHLPRSYLAFEEKAREIIGARVSRGRLEVYFTVTQEGEKKYAVKVDKELAIVYDKSLKELAYFLGIPDDKRVFDFLFLPGVLEYEEIPPEEEAYAPVFTRALEEALTQLVQMREKEGARLKENLEQEWAKVAERVAGIKERAPEIVNNYREKLLRRVQELGGTSFIPPERLALEVAFFAERSNITEELVRLESHLSQFQEICTTSKTGGRKLDFLLQEMQREINTVGAKANDLFVNRQVIMVKGELEKMREQVQNLE